MNITDYISSGILEAYIIGGLNDREALEVEAYAKQYSEIRAELGLLENQLEHIAFSYAKLPSPSIKARLESNLVFAEPKESKEVKIVELSFFYRLTIAASLALAFLSISGAGYFWNKWQVVEGRLVVLESSKSVLVNTVKNTQQQLEGAVNYLQLMKDTNAVFITLKGSSLSPNAAAKVLWNKSTKEVYLSDLALLPAPTSEQQYQLWAIVDGQPVDAGVVEMDKGIFTHQLRADGNVQAFAVTLEPKGGSATPTLTALFLIGKV